MAGQVAIISDDDDEDDAPAGTYTSSAPLERGENVTHLLNELGRPAENEAPADRSRRSDRQAEPQFEVIEVDDDGRPPQTAREAPVVQGEDETYVERQQREQGRAHVDARRQRDQQEAERLGLSLRQYKRHQEKNSRDRSRQEMARLAAQVAELQSKLGTVVEPRLAELDQGRVRQTIADLDRQRADLQARADHQLRVFAEANTAQDVEGMTAALKARDQAIMQASRLEVQRNMLATGNHQGIEQAGGAPQQFQRSKSVV